MSEYGEDVCLCVEKQILIAIKGAIDMNGNLNIRILNIKNDRRFWVILLLLTISGFILRAICCFWGYPYQLHPDEKFIVESSMEMLSRHSYESYVYYRPDQFEIKCNALIFTVFSWIKYQKPAFEAFIEHKSAFYVLARLYTVMFGTAMIPAIAVFTKSLLKRAGWDNRTAAPLLAAGMVAFSTIFVQYSALSTPDIPLAFFTLIFAWLSMYYLEEGNRKYIYTMAVVVGIGISIKYPAAIMCIYISLIVIYKSMKLKKVKEIFIQGLSAILIVLATVFIIAPNLYTDLGNVINSFINEASYSHLGSDGLSISGNLLFYFNDISNCLGLISVIFFVAGCIILFHIRSIYNFVFLVSGIYWICMSALKLHWERWGLPMFIAYIMIAATGAAYILEHIRQKCFQLFKVIGYTVFVVFCVNIILSGIVVSREKIVPDTRVVAMDYCKQNGITTDNSIYESYTPLSPDYGAGAQYQAFELIEEGKVKVKVQYAAKKYLVLSSSIRDRYIEEAYKYPEIAAVYKGFDKTYPLLYYIEPDYNFRVGPFALKNIFEGIRHLINGITYIGNRIYIYDLQPEYVGIQSFVGEAEYINVEETIDKSIIRLSEKADEWAIYQSGDSILLIFPGNDKALGSYDDLNDLYLMDLEDKERHDWMIMNEDGFCYLLYGNRRALTNEGGVLKLNSFIMSDEQKWIFCKSIK